MTMSVLRPPYAKDPGLPHETPGSAPLDPKAHVEDAGRVIFARKFNIICLKAELSLKIPFLANFQKLTKIRDLAATAEFLREIDPPNVFYVPFWGLGGIAGGVVGLKRALNC